jgi:predicted phosphodiesterase
MDKRYKLTNAQFIAEFYKHGGIEPMAAALGMDVRHLQRRRRTVESEEGVSLLQQSRPELTEYLNRRSHQRLTMELKDGVICIASDCHYLPGEATIAHQAFVQAVKHLKPTIVILNGDVADFAQISRHDPMGWQRRYSVKEEVEAIQERTDELVTACPGAKRILTRGNHDDRFNKRLAMHAPEYRGLPGMTLEEQLPDWTHTTSVMLNDSIMIKHSWHSGMHGAWNNVLKAGVTIITGHTHRLTVREFTDYRGTRYGIETGMLADPDEEQFEYALDGPKNWQPGFVVLTIRNGVLLSPEKCEVVPGVGACFRGQVIIPE